MGAHAVTKEQAEEAHAALVRAGGVKDYAAMELGLPSSTFQNRLRAWERMQREAAAAAGRPLPGPMPEPQSDVDILRDRVLELDTQLRRLKEATLTDDYVRRKIIGLRDGVGAVTVPDWSLRMPRGESRPGVPIALWSDWHWGEVVRPEQIGGVNEFNLAIAHKRLRRLVEKTIWLLRSHVVKPEYEGIVVCLGGDMVSGDIHDELTETNDEPLMPCVLDLFGALKWAIGSIADEFGSVFLPCVAGNHGRTTKKPRAKNRAFTNFDWLLYQFLAKAFEGDDRVTFHIPDGPDALFRVYNTRYLLTHGDQFRGGDGIIGAIGPITRGHKKKVARNTAIDQAYDVMLCGHWHQEINLARTIVNGSLKGYDEYANQSNFEFEPPRQALWLTHPTHGITMRMSVHLEDDPAADESAPWISTRKAA